LVMEHIRNIVIGIVVIIAAICLFKYCQNNVLEEKAYESAMNSKSLKQLRKYVTKYEDEGSSDHIEEANALISKLEQDSADYEQILSTSNYRKRLALEKSYLENEDAIHYNQVKEMYNQDRPKDKTGNQEDTETQSGTNKDLATALGEAIGNRIALHKLRSYFKGHVFQIDFGDHTNILVFGPLGSNFTGVGYFINTQEGVSRFAYSFNGEGKFTCNFSDGCVVFEMYENGMLVPATNVFYSKIYDPGTYSQYFR